MSFYYGYVNEEIDNMTDRELIYILNRQFGHGQEPDSGYTTYEISRMNLMTELVRILTDLAHTSPLLHRALYLAELENRCLSHDMKEPLKHKIHSKGRPAVLLNS